MDIFHLHVGEGPIVAAAIHNGHAVRPEVAKQLALDDATRSREEDPFTGQLASFASTRLVGLRSRFEMDLNRPREQCVYLSPEQAWGLNVWRETPPEQLLAESRANYDLFYSTTRTLLEQLIARYGRVVVLDLHSYNHRRDGADAPEANPAENPAVNVGTASADRTIWGPLVDRFITDLHSHGSRGRLSREPLDARENVKFFGGHFSRWINANFPGQACALAVEFKKTFMDEWSCALYADPFSCLQAALASTAPGLLGSLEDLATPLVRPRRPVVPASTS